ncbi:putative lipid II flippase FtsW [Sulfitobacter pseudonitzschiae]|uniref:Probable peptidoglycan glycosyltransferase FtsW n=1 Tax=Pseudosulfitobacter pseudonitzschiae TaxID=1402135 RepID=A0A9Q2NFX2_9RHOB|nr:MULTISPECIES: putative lipid II flippase FtsW [Roseobacteraceae]MBM2291362.1 putative lipid II flippase FtsW [Pseudosulfitobacter pseudonitzschiae]MBM2296280.1 putative lipid II flippase FtsW [Pseudosulfitobacter pseudonitzschiae]MBM2301193.1 putative lipid II flippase FtsW [Pseudosulfitobacter pseudonitzschiae]MBM2310977.1 putative lipid II flippase FtsW [Pseudosulfitobacter pseudonitzschiae]MBM2315890.1 putative lipid II flippase FtsW [Pseudosulfitobacter pseudonitzschiae]|tara:strand:- start:1 stop:1170 length:1170 start_codon:yes stop_codon:yes gene_type:complete
MTEMVYGAAPVRDGEPILPKWWRTIDMWSMSCILILFTIGLLLGLAASPPLAAKNGFEAFHYVQRQAFFGCVALVAMMLTSMMTPVMVRRLAVVGFLLTFVALLLLPFFGTDFGKGATRWFSLGFASVQPSEFLKPGFVVVCAWMMAAGQDLNGPPGRMWSFILCVTIVLMLALQPDFGQACLVLFGWGVMYFVAGAPMLLLVGMAGLVVMAGTVAYSSSEHFARRIDGFLSADIDPTTQLGYATNAIREGGLFGVGVGEGEVKWSLPDAHTDFIIAVAAEEYGLILVLVIIALYTVVVVRSLLRLMRERDPFIRLAGTGLACTFGVQAMINMGVAVRLLPAKGMTLPFVSYGGSSVIASGIALGMLLAFTRTRPQGEISDLLGRGRGR